MLEASVDYFTALDGVEIGKEHGRLSLPFLLLDNLKTAGFRNSEDLHDLKKLTSQV